MNKNKVKEINIDNSLENYFFLKDYLLFYSYS